MKILKVIMSLVLGETNIVMRNKMCILTIIWMHVAELEIGTKY